MIKKSQKNSKLINLLISDVCKASAGWQYSASSSRYFSSGGGGGGFSYSMSELSVICGDSLVPQECIREHPQCQWCAQEVNTFNLF